jgi:hypothetical protein
MRRTCARRDCAAVADAIVKLSIPDPQAPNVNIRICRFEYACADHGQEIISRGPRGASFSVTYYPSDADIAKETDRDEPFESDGHLAIAKAAEIIGLVAWR